MYYVCVFKPCSKAGGISTRLSFKMATSDLLAALKQDLVCPVCYGEFTQPKVLQCKHVFCSNCLSKWLQDRKLVCPICRAVQVVSRSSGVHNLPEPLIIASLQEKIADFLQTRKNSGPVSRKCGHCDGKAVYFCLSCVKNLCNDCSDRHKRNRVSKSHDLVYISKKTVCEKHPLEFLNCYCVDCKRGLCMVCVDLEHGQHDVIDIKDLVQDRKDKLEMYCDKQEAIMVELDTITIDVKRAGEKLSIKHQYVSKQLDNVRAQVNDVIDKYQKTLTDNLAAELKRLTLFEEEVDRLRASQESLISYLDTMKTGNSPAELVQSVDELPEAPESSVPVGLTYKIPGFNDPDHVVDAVKQLLTFRDSHGSHDLTSSPDTGRKDTFRRLTVGRKAEKISPERRGLTGSRETSSLSPSPVLRRADRRRSRGQVGSSTEEDTVPKVISGGVAETVPKVMVALGTMRLGTTLTPQPPNTSHQAWEAQFDTVIHDVTWDPHVSSPGWWVRTADGLYRCGPDGRVGDRVGQEAVHGEGRLCVDTLTDLLVTTDQGTRVICLSREGNAVLELEVRGSSLTGVTHCPHEDVYVISDTGAFIGDPNHKLYYVETESGRVVRSVGCFGAGDGQFNRPLYLHHHHGNTGTCMIVVSDNANHRIQVYNAKGDYIQTYGGKGRGAGKLKYPCGVCVDRQDRLVVCDWGNQRVVRYGLGREGSWEVVLTTQDLGGGWPTGVGVSGDGRYLAVAMGGEGGVVRGFRYDRLPLT